MSCFYNRIDTLLKSKKLTNKDLSEHLGLSSVQIYANWKQRKTVPSASEAVKIAEFLGTSVEFLVTGSDTTGLAIENQKLKEKIQKITDILSCS